MPKAIAIHRKNRTIRDILGFEASCEDFLIDPIYGPISLTDVECRVIRTRIFQRLKNIKQLGLASSVYPGANHSRFEHSVGTLYTTWELFKRFLVNISSHRRWLRRFDLTSFEADRILQALRLAGLLHDIGHGPFSHAFETLLDSYPGPKRLNHESLTLFMLAHGLDEKMEPSDDRTIQGVREIARRSQEWDQVKADRWQIAQAIGNRRLRRQILMILNKHVSFSDFDPPVEFLEVRDFLNEMITGDIGSDRIDYLLRDTYFTGLGHRFNLSQMLESICGIYDSEKETLTFAVDADTRNAVEFFLTTRYYHYRLIAHNTANLDEEFRFKRSIDPNVWSDPLQILRLAMLDEYQIQKHLKPTKKEYSRVFTSDLRDIKVGDLRYFLYRIATDSALRPKYIDVIKENVLKEVKRVNPNSKLREEDVFIEIVLEKPRIPLLHVYRDHYRIEKTDSIEYHSTLFHDWSDIVPALGRTYLLDSLFMVYVPKNYRREAKKALFSTRSFYTSRRLFKEFLLKNMKKIHRLDILMAAVYDLTSAGMKSFVGMSELLDQVSSIQERLDLLEYEMETCYDAEEDTSFSYCRDVLNDLLIFAVANAIRVEIKYMRSKSEKGKPAWKPKYEISPIITHIRTQDIYRSNLEMILDYYPTKVRSFLQIKR